MPSGDCATAGEVVEQGECQRVFTAPTQSYAPAVIGRSGTQRILAERLSNGHAEVFQAAGCGKFILTFNKQARLAFTLQPELSHFDIRQRTA